MSGWTRIEVAIAVPAAPPIMWADAINAGRRVGAAEHWALHYDEIKMLVLRSTIPVRSNEATPGKPAAEKALKWWRDRLMFVTLNTEFDQPVWTWVAGNDAA